MSDIRRWSPEEDAELRRLRMEGASWEVCSQILGNRTAGACRRQFDRSDGGIHRKAFPPWTKEQLEILRELYGKVPAQVIARRVGRTTESVRTKARKLGLVSGRTGDVLAPAEVAPVGVFLKLRRCHDCGRPTPDYRCPECWARIRGEEDFSLEDATD